MTILKASKNIRNTRERRGLCMQYVRKQRPKNVNKPAPVTGVEAATPEARQGPRIGHTTLFLGINGSTAKTEEIRKCGQQRRSTASYFPTRFPAFPSGKAFQ